MANIDYFSIPNNLQSLYLSMLNNRKYYSTQSNSFYTPNFLSTLDAIGFFVGLATSQGASSYENRDYFFPSSSLISRLKGSIDDSYERVLYIPSTLVENVESYEGNAGDGFRSKNYFYELSSDDNTDSMTSSNNFTEYTKNQFLDKYSNKGWYMINLRLNGGNVRGYYGTSGSRSSSTLMPTITFNTANEGFYIINFFDAYGDAMGGSTMPIYPSYWKYALNSNFNNYIKIVYANNNQGCPAAYTPWSYGQTFTVYILYKPDIMHMLFDDINYKVATTTTEASSTPVSEFVMWNSYTPGPGPGPGPEPPPEQDPAYNGQSNGTTDGGDGDYDDTNTDSHEDITLPNQLVDDETLTDYVNIAGIFPYYLTDAQLNEFMMYLNLFKFGDLSNLTNVRNYILSIKRVPYTPVYKSTAVAMRYAMGLYCSYDLNTVHYSVYAKPIAEEYTKLDFGYVDVNEYWGSFLDYHPYTKIKLYLPFYGYVYVNANLVMNRSVKIIYIINNITTVAHIEVVVKYFDEHEDDYVEQTIMQFTTQPLGYDQPYNAADYKDAANALVQTGIYVAGGLVAGAAGAIGADVVTETKTITESVPYNNIQEYKNALNFLRDSGVKDYRQVNTGPATGSFEYDNSYEETTRIPKKVDNPIKPPSVQSTVDALLNMDSISSNGSNNTTLLSQKTPLIYIERPILQFPKEAYAKLYGIPLNMYLHLGDLSGFTVVSDYRDDSLTCTEQEKRLIEDLLKGGVVL